MQHPVSQGKTSLAWGFGRGGHFGQTPLGGDDGPGGVSCRGCLCSWVARSWGLCAGMSELPLLHRVCSVAVQSVAPQGTQDCCIHYHCPSVPCIFWGVTHMCFSKLCVWACTLGMNFTSGQQKSDGILGIQKVLLLHKPSEEASSLPAGPPPPSQALLPPDSNFYHLKGNLFCRKLGVFPHCPFFVVESDPRHGPMPSISHRCPFPWWDGGGGMEKTERKPERQGSQESREPCLWKVLKRGSLPEEPMAIAHGVLPILHHRPHNSPARSGMFPFSQVSKRYRDVRSGAQHHTAAEEPGAQGLLKGSAHPSTLSSAEPPEKKRGLLLSSQPGHWVGLPGKGRGRWLQCP